MPFRSELFTIPGTARVGRCRLRRPGHSVTTQSALPLEITGSNLSRRQLLSSKGIVGRVQAPWLGVGAPEALVIAVVALLVFGPKGLAEVARTLGRSLKAFQPTIQELQVFVDMEGDRGDRGKRKRVDKEEEEITEFSVLMQKILELKVKPYIKWFCLGESTAFGLLLQLIGIDLPTDKVKDVRECLFRVYERLHGQTEEERLMAGSSLQFWGAVDQ
ncbi:hypothetical protein R1sor_000035 [Riccia sorocarpa]|uniref:Sec-independent protein translocase protein TATB, chloroplastic n=1 Tax=Riccia sorocarpa TaxID=122646 RepID=A0ABD3GSS7_9MARC